MYVIVRTDHGKREYAAPLGSEHSYTKYLQQARTFATREAAEREKCGNELVHRIEDEIGRPSERT